MTDISAIAVFHHEGPLALPALASMARAVSVAREAGLAVEALAFLDRPDRLTRKALDSAGAWLDRIDEVDFGDLGSVRNAGAEMASGEFLAFLDGDDLWGEQWLSSAWNSASAHPSPGESVWHPEYLLLFDADDLALPPAPGGVANPAQKSLWFHHGSCYAPGFDARVLLFENIWSANVFASRRLHLAHPYLRVDAEGGFGIEDWSWNAETLAAGVAHLVVNDTVHLIRMRPDGSLNLLNQARGLLPVLPGLPGRYASAPREA